MQTIDTTRPAKAGRREYVTAGTMLDAFDNSYGTVGRAELKSVFARHVTDPALLAEIDGTIDGVRDWLVERLRGAAR